MRYAAVIEYIKDAAKVGEVRPKHREYLDSLLKGGRLACAGPFLDDFGALIVYEADSVEAAEKLIRADPFHAAGVFVRWDVRPWKVVFHNPDVMTEPI